jgi:hypothetical protein
MGIGMRAGHGAAEDLHAGYRAGRRMTVGGVAACCGGLPYFRVVACYWK